MTSELQAFIDYFGNEEELRSAIEGLLSKREDITGIRNLHGKDEYGKDLIFYAPAGLGRPRLNACVVKLEKITGSASNPASGARNVVIQCNQALDTAVVNTQGQDEWVSYVYVMCPNELSATAMQSIAGEFKGRASQIEFVCGQDFLQLFRECWPNFIFFEPDLLSAHLDTLGKELSSDGNIHRLATAHGLNSLAQKRNIYVEPLLSLLRGQFSRGVSLPESRYLYQITSLYEIEEFRTIVGGLIASLQIVDYLPESIQKRRGRAEQALQGWPDRFEKEWSNAFSRARTESLKQDRNAPIPVVPVPKRVVDEFLTSEGFRFVGEVYGALDSEIERGNSSLTRAGDTVGLLSDPAFGTYGSLLHASSVQYPTVQFVQEGVLEWKPEEVFTGNRSILVTGAPGYGKTSFARNHFLADLENFKSGRSCVLPLYFAAHALALGERQSFEDVFIRPEVAAKLAMDNSIAVRIYLDGIDEIRSKELRNLVLRIVSENCNTGSGRYHCIATAREHVGGYRTSTFARVKLSPFTTEKVRELVTAWLDGDIATIDDFYSELGHSESMLPVLGVPLLATLTVLVFKNLRRLPENKLRLYQMFIDLLLGGWNLAKGLQRSSTYSSTTKLPILTRLAGVMHSDRVKECKELMVASTVKQVAPALLPSIQGVVGELVEDGLLLPTGRATYTYPHLSFQEYLAAKDAIDPARQEEKRIVKSYLAGDDWYKEVANFIASMTTNPQRMREWIVDLARPLAGAHGLSDSEKRAAFLISKLSEAFPDCKAVPAR